MIFWGNIPQCRSALVSWWINTMAEHGKCGRAKYGSSAFFVLSSIEVAKSLFDRRRTIHFSTQKGKISHLNMILFANCYTMTIVEHEKCG
jgi:hypothetical protein